MSTVTVLPQGAGYGVGIGLFFSAFMLALTAMQARYTPWSPKTLVKPALIASGIVSAWTWAATLLQSSAVAYKYGISGPWWYAVPAYAHGRALPQLAAKLKLNAPYAHTWLEIIGARWGTVAHLVFMFFGLATNVIVSAMLVLGGSATVTDLTGMNTIAACFLIPVGVAIYVVVGGMRSTLLCDYTHTTVLFVIILYFVFTVYTGSPKIGSPARMHELLSAAPPVAGNAGGSYLTMRSKNGLIFGVINIVGNFATVFQDQAYWQRAIASRPASAVRAYLLGGIAWFAIPFTLATTLGLAAVALGGNENATYRDPDMRPLSAADVSAGLPAAAAAAALSGPGGAAALLILLFLAVTSACSAELIAVSSIGTYDVYKRYINPKATEEQLLRVGHICVAVYAIACGFFGLIFYYIGVSMGWLYTFMGVLLGGAVCPIAIGITWRRANRTGCVVGAITGLVAGVGTWLGTTARLSDGVINVTTSGGDYEMLAGNLASIGVGAIVSLTWSLIVRPSYTFESPLDEEKRATGEEKRASDEGISASGDEKRPASIKEVQTIVETAEADDDLDPVALKRAFRFAAWASLVLLIVLVLAIPLPLFFAQTIYGVQGLTTWVGIGIAWTFLAAGVVVVGPVWESRRAMTMIMRGLMKDIFTRGGGKFAPQKASAA
ncbi:hypothetical protein BD626DRAFT_546072 [Schizophyllum amplum]|uniref:Urea transporter n=1 Tax=Schizophyllum amplum TaxID=97359 RepID=A0A550CQL8_9AGAR|nr:hypothetical protein BD626DRAFT_546072 [Auriculariopsis ampla]